MEVVDIPPWYLVNCLAKNSDDIHLHKQTCISHYTLLFRQYKQAHFWLQLACQIFHRQQKENTSMKYISGYLVLKKASES